MSRADADRAGDLISQELARTWIDRWDAQQEMYLPDREERFTALIDAVEAAAGRPDPLVLDVGSGPGSLAVRLLRRIPAATVVALDADPLTLALGRAAWRDQDGLRFADIDLRAPGWSAELALDRQPDAAVSTTALHWLTGESLAALYAELAAILRPGGVVLNGDHLQFDEAEPALARLGAALIEKEEERRFPGGHPESWTAWWEAAAADPALAALVAERAARQVASDHHDSPARLLSVQVAALRTAGFSEVGTLWQRGDNRLLCAVLPG